MFRFLFAFVAAAATASALGPFSITGRVVFGDGGPVANAEISLTKNGWDDVADPILTGARGQFTFTQLEEGLYYLSASRRDLGFAHYGHTPKDGEIRGIELGPKHPHEEVLFHVDIPCVISGVVHGPQGLAVSGVTLFASRRGGPEEGGRFIVEKSSNSDDLGRFRIANLHWGRYRLCASAHGAPALPQGVATFDDPNPPLGYMESCYDSLITLRPGQAFDVDFTFLPSSPVSVRGIVSNLPPDTNANVQLLDRDGSFPFGVSGAIYPDRRFQLANVAPGNYWLIARVNPKEGPPLFAQLPVAAGSSDIDGLNMVLAPEPKIGVIVRKPESQKVSIAVQNADDGSLIYAQSGKDGALHLSEIKPGRYWLVTRTELCQQSAKFGDQDIMSKPFEIAEGATGKLEVSFTDQCGSIDGEVTGVTPASTHPRVLLLITGTAELPGDFLAESTGDDGKFGFFGLPPGKYPLWIWNEKDEWNGTIGDLRSMAAKRTEVEVKAKEITKVQLDLPGGQRK